MKIPGLVSTFEFCDGSPYCVKCYRPHTEGVLQKCQPGKYPKPDPSKPAPAAPTMRIVSSPGGECGGCKGPETKEPHLFRKFLNWREAKKKWKEAGYPVRTQQEVDALLSVCQSCEHLLDRGGKRQRCAGCGCPINGRTDKPTKNKLAMATEHCPLKEPKW